MSKSESAFYDLELFPWINFLESKKEIIAKELNSFLQNESLDKLWQENYKHYVQHKSDDGCWKTLTLKFFGIHFNQIRDYFPQTCDILDQIEGLVTAQFSFLQKQTKILPHKGYTKMLARAHLPLDVPFPDLCGIKVGGKIRHWEEGKILVFNDGIEHEAWNNSEAARVLLLLDVPNPILHYSAEEICLYKLSNIDNELANIADKSEWLKWYSQGFFD